MPFGQLLRSQPEPFQRVRPVPVHQDVGRGEQFVQPGPTLAVPKSSSALRLPGSPS